MRYFSCFLLLGLAAFPARTAEPAAATLTPKEIADGWIMLFDGKTTFGWQIQGDAKIENGILILGGDKPTTATTTTPFHGHVMDVEYRFKGNLSTSYFRWGESRQLTSFSILPDETKWNKLHSKGDRFFAPFTFQVGPKSTLAIRSVKLQPAGLVPVFNGKDLTGWKEHPGKKSKFSVTPEGWINIKNGPGDLQTLGEWGDFVLQIECISNGKFLNSGVFCRCRPNEYQQGYEAQIHNGFLPGPTKDYTIEEFDPVTHKSVGKKKVKYAAIDYGTGAIYRRQPARFQASKDHEWFTMTVSAVGNHFATWVNGIQVTDWTDNRPSADNARNGYRAKKGPISLQGHDPTTDLSFRNIRIAELPQAPPEKK